MWRKYDYTSPKIFRLFGVVLQLLRFIEKLKEVISGLKGARQVYDKKYPCFKFMRNLRDKPVLWKVKLLREKGSQSSPAVRRSAILVIEAADLGFVHYV
jgi:hypothetical protein